MRKRVFIVLVFCAFSLGAATQQISPETASRQRLITRLTARTLERSHYSRKKLDDAMSSRIFDGYFELLDPNKLFFTKEDIARFEPLRHQLDDLLLRGNSDFAFDVYELYRTRVSGYRAFAEKKVKEGLDFAGHDSYVPDRRKLPRCSNGKELRQVWLAKLKNDVLYFRLFQRAMKQEQEKGKKETEAAAGAVNRFWERKTPEEKVLTRLKDLDNSVAKMEPGEVLGLYLSAACLAYGPHSSYLSPQSEEDFDIHMKLSLTGIGATLTSEDGYIRVVEIVPGGPAARQGQLKTEDRILSVAQEGNEPVDLIDMPVAQAVKLIRGPIGTKVTLTVLSGEKVNAVPRNITIVRGKVELKESEASGSVRTIKCSDGSPRRIGIIDLPGFYMDFDAYLKNDPNAKCCSTDVKKILADFKKQKVDAVVMDLRRNGGGSLPDAIRLAGLFIKDGPVVQVRTRDRRLFAQGDDDGETSYDGPMVVLISKFSASASEIFAGAMKDYNRALIVGDSRSFGKGTVLEVIPLERMLSFFTQKFPAGSVTYESHVFYRVSGSSVQQMGIKPDIQLPSFSESMEVGEMFSKNHLPWDAVAATDYTPAFPKLTDAQLEQLKSASAARVGKSAEFRRILERAKQFEQARKKNLLSLNEEQRWQDYLKEKALDEERDAAELEEKNPRKTKRDDAILEEAAAIAGDLAAVRK